MNIAGGIVLNAERVSESHAEWVRERIMQAIDDVALRDASDLDYETWRSVTEIFENLIEARLHVLRKGGAAWLR